MSLRGGQQCLLDNFWDLGDSNTLMWRMFLSEEVRHGIEKVEKKNEQSVRKEVNITDGQSCSSVRNAAEGK